MRLLDIAEMPGHNPTTGAHGLHSVSEGKVRPDEFGKPCCTQHGAMNAVNPDRTIWRCVHAVPACGEGSYVEWP